LKNEQKQDHEKVEELKKEQQKQDHKKAE